MAEWQPWMGDREGFEQQHAAQAPDEVGIGPVGGAGGQGGGSYSTGFRVGDQTFGSRGEAQGYIDNNSAPTGLTRNMPEFGEFEESPGYQFQLDEGMKALERQQSARGMRLGASASKDFMRFGTGLASQDYGNWWNRQRTKQRDYVGDLLSLAGYGSQATAQQVGSGTNYASAFGQTA